MITIDQPQESQGFIASVMMKVATSINFDGLDVKVPTTRRMRVGGILLKMESEDKAGKIRDVMSISASVQKQKRWIPVVILSVSDLTEAEDVASGLIKVGVLPEELTLKGKSRFVVRVSQGDLLYGLARVDLPMATAILSDCRSVTVE